MATFSSRRAAVRPLSINILDDFYLFNYFNGNLNIFNNFNRNFYPYFTDYLDFYLFFTNYTCFSRIISK